MCAMRALVVGGITAAVVSARGSSSIASEAAAAADGWDGHLLVRLCDEVSRARLSQHIKEQHDAAGEFEGTVVRHLTNLPRLPMLEVLGASKKAATYLNEHDDVCGVEAVTPHSHGLGDASRGVSRHVFEGSSPRGGATERPERLGVEAPLPTEYWNLDRLNQPALPLDGDVSFNFTGAGVSIFLLATGVDTAHAEFSAGQVENVGSFVEEFRDGVGAWRLKPEWGWVENPKNTSDVANNDREGFGTEMAGVIAGLRSGPAPGAKIYSIKVLGDDGSGSNLGILAAMDAVAGVIRQGFFPDGVIVNSPATGYCRSDPVYCSEEGDYALAVADLVDAGARVTAAGAGAFSDACFFQPSAAKAAITTIASDESDDIQGSSNLGKCVDIVAPGVDLLAPSSTGAGAAIDTYSYVSNSPYASGVTSGVLALYVEALQGDMDAAVSALLGAASNGVLTGPGPEFPQSALFDDCPSNNALLQAPPAVLDAEFVAPDCPVVASESYEIHSVQEVGYCSGSNNKVNATSAAGCWASCTDLLGAGNLIAADYYYYDNECWCQDSCACMIPLDYFGELLVPPATTLPATCQGSHSYSYEDLNLADTALPSPLPTPAPTLTVIPTYTPTFTALPSPLPTPAPTLITGIPKDGDGDDDTEEQDGEDEDEDEEDDEDEEEEERCDPSCCLSQRRSLRFGHHAGPDCSNCDCP